MSEGESHTRSRYDGSHLMEDYTLTSNPPQPGGLRCSCGWRWSPISGDGMGDQLRAKWDHQKRYRLHRAKNQST